ncbi:MAG: DUF4136 domain-containing protein [Gammaproteobacteria bacterium]|nr:DUF4136 domain-containing protein [Gammaproteobacteria bacterium]MDH4314088.1 DUF4136 domain-containing protein [Gammaproteobacteria bacterium]MDH5213131.1 DUF4136 domain-containing protein [Gammaproteobacteria bacterium]MDH5499605.1 DUF4136 domain-containing protein [Gammaproteobacteria bacterium]
MRLTVIFGIFILAALSACATSNLRSDYDKTVDFGQYKTYNFYANAGPENTEYQSLFSQYVMAAITREMEARGYTRSDDPDLLVNFNAILEDKTQITTSPAPMAGGYYGYRRGFYDPWYGYGYAQETNVSQYTEGTFNIDLVDPRRKKLVWEAVDVARVTEKKLKNMEVTINKAVPKYFANFPFRAGEGTPVGK